MKKLIVCYIILLFSINAHALTGLVLTANYWPGYVDNNPLGGALYNGNNWGQAALAKSPWTSRAPWYCAAGPTGSDQLACHLTQANMDQEIQLAEAVGISNFAFYWTGAQAGGVNFQNNPVFQEAWDLYQSSTQNTRVKWTLNFRVPFIGANPWSDTTQWHANVDQIVAYFGQSTYQKVTVGGTPNRPLVYLFYVAADLTSWFAGSTANLATAIAYLRTQTLAAGMGTPYVVVQGAGTGAGAATLLTTLGGDAVSNYFSGGPGFYPATVAADNSYATFDTSVQTYWNSLSSGGVKCVPILHPSQDIRARFQTPDPNNVGIYFPRFGMNLYYIEGTPAEIAAGQMTALGTWMDANPTKHDSIAWLYSWTEHHEGGTAALQPTLGDPPLSDPPYAGGASSGLTLKLNAIGPVLYGYR